MKASTFGVIMTALIGAAWCCAIADNAATYTDSQAAQGAKAYAQSCAECHGAKLQGVNAPALSGSSFKGKQTVGQIYTLMSAQMPLSAPGSLTPTAYAAIMAFILKENGHPAGGAPLQPSTAKSITETI